MTKYVIAYAATALCFLGIDMLWLGAVAKGFYRDRIGALLLDDFNLTAAGLFYLFYVVGVVVFAVAPALHAGSWRIALVSGGLLGLIAYGTYDMTNLATLRGWSPTVSFVDMAWGTVLTAVAATTGYFAARWLA